MGVVWLRLPPLRQIKKKGCRKAALFLYLARDDARCASPHALLCNAWAPPFAGLSPPLSGQPLNRGACSSRWIYLSHRELRVKLHASPAGAFPHDR
ncbi:protein of unknown function [Stenotrophomonas maltophilia]|nr:protein of unknown function [Stenotrophomonas maltophilia]